ncbi:MAG: menaquinone biosynthesis protein [Planctomycetes bacterium]|nr:menaquinone biosynthesis protein [Planctomycetota bacterium]
MPTVHRIGSVPYLNAKPLITSLAARSDVELHLMPPRPLSALLAEGRVDVALIPTFEFLRQPSYRAVPGIAIASRGPVRSVLLFHRVPVDRVRRVAVDQSSLSSAALVRVILERRYGLEPIYADVPPDFAALDRETDAVLLIGDPAMQAAAKSVVPRLDLGDEWQKLTGLPFVYAVFAIRPHADETQLTRLLLEAKARGIGEIDAIADAHSTSLGIAAVELRSYLREAIRFDLGADEMSGIEAFRDRAFDLGLLESRRTIDVAEAGLTSAGTS